MDVTLVSASQVQASINAERERVACIGRAYDAVAGIFPDALRRTQTTDDNIKVNLMRPAVTILNSYLFGTPPSWELPKAQDKEEASEVDSPKEAWMKECLRVNAWHPRLLGLAENGALSGTPFLRFDVPDPTNRDNPYPRITTLDPANTSIVTDPSDIERVTAYWHSWIVFSGASKAMTYLWRTALDDTTGKWSIMEMTKQGQHPIGSPNYYVLDSWKLQKDWEWGPSWSPILHCQNLPNPNRVYGTPDITDLVIKANHKLNFKLSNAHKVERLQGHGREYITGIEAETFKKLDVSPGRIIPLPENATMGMLIPPYNQAAFDSAVIGLLKFILMQLFLPGMAMAGVDSPMSNPSGRALKTELAPLLKLTETKQTMYTPFLVETLRRLYELGGYGPDNVVSLTWPELIPTDPLEEAQSLKMDLGMDIVSKATVAAKRGYNWETEQANIEAEKQAGADRMQQAMGTTTTSTQQPTQPPQNGTQTQPGQDTRTVSNA